MSRLVNIPPSATFAVLSASASGLVAAMVLVASASWLCVLSGMSTVMTVRGSFLREGRQTGWGERLGPPCAEPLGEQGEDGGRLEVPRDRDERVVRAEVGVVEADQVLPPDGAHRLDRATRRLPPGVLRSVEQPRHLVAGQRARVAAPLLQAGEGDAAHALDVGRAEGGVQGHVGQEVQGRLQGLGQAVEVDADPVEARGSR